MNGGRLPIGLSVPHAWGEVPDYIQPYCALTFDEIAADSDGESAVIYHLAPLVQEFVSTPIARSVLDMNRGEDDRSWDGVVKTHTRSGLPVYRRPLAAELVEQLIEEHHRPYHRALSEFAGRVRLGVDCHTAVHASAVEPERVRSAPLVCLCEGDGTCPQPWVEALVECFVRHFAGRVTVDEPGHCGHTVRTHGREMPWVRLELSCTTEIDVADKRRRVIAALRDWCELELPSTGH